MAAGRAFTGKGKQNLKGSLKEQMFKGASGTPALGKYAGTFYTKYVKETLKYIYCRWNNNSPSKTFSFFNLNVTKQQYRSCWWWSLPTVPGTACASSWKAERCERWAGGLSFPHCPHGGSSQSPFTDGMKDPVWVVPSRINFPEKKIFFCIKGKYSHMTFQSHSS